MASQPPKERTAPVLGPRIPKFTREQVAKRNHIHDAAIIVDNVIYDVTDFLEDHPGEGQVLMEKAGQDASEAYHEVRHSEYAFDWRKELVVGEVVDEDRWPVRGETVPPEPEPDRFAALMDFWAPLALAVLLVAIVCTYLLQ